MNALAIIVNGSTNSRVSCPEYGIEAARAQSKDKELSRLKNDRKESCLALERSSSSASASSTCNKRTLSEGNDAHEDGASSVGAAHLEVALDASVAARPEEAVDASLAARPIAAHFPDVDTCSAVAQTEAEVARSEGGLEAGVTAHSEGAKAATEVTRLKPAPAAAVATRLEVAQALSVAQVE